MTRWSIPISIDERPHGLIVDAHSARAALAQLSRHRANGARNPGLRISYATAGGGHMDIRWGQAGEITVGLITEMGPEPAAPITPAA